MFRPSPRPRDGVPPVAVPFDATVEGTAPQEAPGGPETTGRGHAAHAAGVMARRPRGGTRLPLGNTHGELDNAGRGHAARADDVAVRQPWCGVRRSERPGQVPRPADRNTPRPPRPRGGAALTAIGGSGRAARADDGARDWEDGAPHSESDGTGRGLELRQDLQLLGVLEF